jgi:hypothetical protein
MKVMILLPGLGAKRRHSLSYGKALQQRRGSESALSCFEIFELEHLEPHKLGIVGSNPTIATKVFSRL